MQEVVDDELKSGTESIDTGFYIRETAQTFRVRAEEHMKSLKNLEPESFQVEHWAHVHNDNVTSPKFNFKVFGQFTDALTRQLTEAVHIMAAGNLNKKHEFRVNNLYQIEASVDPKDRERNKLELLRKG